MQGCFRFSMNGTAPAVDSETIRALLAYSYWMSKGAPVGVKLSGAGMVHMAPPSRSADPFCGEEGL
ncbi:cytochrome c, class I [mine drainage metagenome]|uniref:Cytochrome c, class I n=1 Tax=mine drainage metagenome TaxID=410659 RepID=T1C075_9ZZZZ